MSDFHIHINRPTGHYIGQVRRYGHRRWESVTGNCKTPENALSQAVLAMKNTQDMHRARALFIDASGWHEPHLVMEAKR